MYHFAPCAEHHKISFLIYASAKVKSKKTLIQQYVSIEVFIDGSLSKSRYTKVVQDQDAATSFFTFPHESRHIKQL